MMENDAYLELRRRLCGLSVAVTELYRKVAPPTREKWLSTQEVCEALHISQRALQNYRDRGIIPYSTIGSKFYYRETDVERVIREALLRRQYVGHYYEAIRRVQGTDAWDVPNPARDRNGHETFAADDRSGALSDRR